MYTYWNGNEYTGAVQFDRDGNPLDAAGQPLEYTETASPHSGLEAGNESGVMQAAGEAEQIDRTESEMFGLDLAPNLRDEGDGFFKTLFTAGSNLSTDTIQELDYIAQAVASPIDTGEAILRVLAGYAQKALPNAWEQYLPEDWATNKMYANAINDYYADKYGSLEQAMDAFAEKPVSVALDALAIKAIMTTISRQAVKRSNTTAQMAKTAEGTPFESELAARAAAELKVAQELERTVKYEGKLVYDEAIGAYVPEASVTKPPKIDTAEVAPIVSAIDEAVPTLNNAPLSTEGMMAATRNKEVNPALVDNYETRLNNPFMDEVLAINERGLGSVPPLLPDGSLDNARVIEGMNIADEVAPITAEAMGTNKIAVGDFRLDSRLMNGDTASRLAVVTKHIKDIKAAIADDFSITPTLAPRLYDEAALLRAEKGIEMFETSKANLTAQLADEVKPATTTGINLQGMRAGDGSLVAATRNQTVAPALAENAIKMADDAKVVASRADDAKMALAARPVGTSNAATKADNAKLARDEKLMTDAVRNDTVSAALMDDATRVSGDVWQANMAARYANDKSAFKTPVIGKSNAATRANQGKLDRDKQRMADDEIMAAASQAELFSPDVPAAAYEIAQASKIANDLAKVSPDVPAVVGTRMMAPTESTKLAKYADVERRTTPPSIPQTKLKVDVKKVVPAIQRVAAASSQAERGADNSFLPAQPTDIHPDLSEPFVPIVPERIDVEQPENTRPGWKLPHQFEGSTREGNYWSADFEDEHWNTPAGINEAMGVWGRPVGNRRIVNPR